MSCFVLALGLDLASRNKEVQFWDWKEKERDMKTQRA